MGKTVFTIVCAWFAMLAMSAQEQPEELYTLQGDGKLVVNEKYRATNEVYDLKEKVGTYKRKLVDAALFTVGEYSYELRCYVFEGWEDETGDCNVIQLYHKGKMLIEHIDIDGICYLHTGRGNPCADLKDVSAIPNRFAVISPLAKGVTALIFKTYTFPYEPSKMPIFIVKGEQAVKVFNRKMEITSITLGDKALDIIMEDRFQEYMTDENGNDVPAGSAPLKYRLFSTEDGTLKFQQVKE